MQALLLRILAYLLAVVLLVGGGAFAGYHYTDQYLTAKFTAQIDALNTESANKLNELQKAKSAIEAKQTADAAKAQEDHDKTIATLNDTIAKLRAEHVQLHDPGASRQSHSAARPGAKPSASSSVVHSSSGTTLSDGATNFLLSFAGRADTVRADLLQCQADDASIRTAVDEYNAKLKEVNEQNAKQAQQAVDKQ